MTRLVVNIKDDTKLAFVIKWLKQFDFIDIYKKNVESEKHDFFASAGMWEDREINSDELRKKAWNRNK